MQQTFSKTINGHNLEFNRLLYPLRYVITVHDEKQTGAKIEIIRDKEGKWNLNRTGQLPEWSDGITKDICDEILKNERKQQM